MRLCQRLAPKFMCDFLLIPTMFIISTFGRTIYKLVKLIDLQQSNIYREDEDIW